MARVGVMDYDKLKYRCNQSIRDILHEAGTVFGKKGSQYSYKDNDSKILAIAHTDYVRNLDKHFDKAHLTTESLVYSPRLDDRLGVYTILDVLPRLQINVDILLTENEEVGHSTASNFTATKKYNWMVEFDRRGEDAVVYNYTEFYSVVSKYFTVGRGTFSDICKLTDLECCGVNVGIGYHNEHTNRCFMSTHEYVEQLSKFIKMFRKEENTFYKYTPISTIYTPHNTLIPRRPINNINYNEEYDEYELWHLSRRHLLGPNEDENTKQTIESVPWTGF